MTDIDVAQIVAELQRLASFLIKLAKIRIVLVERTCNWVVSQFEFLVAA